MKSKGREVRIGEIPNACPMNHQPATASGQQVTGTSPQLQRSHLVHGCDCFSRVSRDSGRDPSGPSTRTVCAREIEGTPKLLVPFIGVRLNSTDNPASRKHCTNRRESLRLDSSSIKTMISQCWTKLAPDFGPAAVPRERRLPYQIPMPGGPPVLHSTCRSTDRIVHHCGNGRNFVPFRFKASNTTPV